MKDRATLEKMKRPDLQKEAKVSILWLRRFLVD